MIHWADFSIYVVIRIMETKLNYALADVEDFWLGRGSSFSVVAKLLTEAIENRRGLSLVRLGDGESSLLFFDGKEPDARLQILSKTWFGEQTINTEDWGRIQSSLVEAVRHADIVGLPRPYQLQKMDMYRVIIPVIADLYRDREPVLTDNMAHFFLQWSGLLGSLLKAAVRVVTIGCRDLEGPLLTLTGKANIQTVLVKGESQFPGTIEEQHWPQGYEKVIDKIEDCEPGDLVLVGAGPLGKIYCDKAKSRGAVAVDIGSVFDGWAAVDSRKFLSGAPRRIFSVEHLENCPGSADEARARVQMIIRGTRFADGIY